MNLTINDVGKAVKLANGTIAIIEAMFPNGRFFILKRFYDADGREYFGNADFKVVEVLSGN